MDTPQTQKPDPSRSHVGTVLGGKDDYVLTNDRHEDIFVSIYEPGGQFFFEVARMSKLKIKLTFDSDVLASGKSAEIDPGPGTQKVGLNIDLKEGHYCYSAVVVDSKGDQFYVRGADNSTCAEAVNSNDPSRVARRRPRIRVGIPFIPTP